MIVTQSRWEYALSSSILIRTVIEDLEYLRTDWCSEISDVQLRRGSTTLRRLLADGELQQAWKAANLDKEPQVPAFVVPALATVFDFSSIVCATAGGAVHRGVQAAGMVLLDCSAPDEQLEKHRALGIPQALLGLRAFTEGECIRLRSGSLNRRQLVKYVANHLGGAHVSVKRVKAHEAQLFAELDESSRRMQILGKPVTYFELLSIGQALANAPDLRKLTG